MKNVFGVLNTKDDSDLKEYDGACFISKQISDELQSEHDKLCENTTQSMKKMGVSVIRILPKYILLALGLIIAVNLITDILEAGSTFSNSLNEHPILYVIATVFLIASGILFAVDHHLTKKYTDSEEFQEFIDHAEQTVAESMETLGIPEDSESVEVLSFTYKVKNGKTSKANSYDFMPIDMYIFTDEEYLYLSDSCTLLSFRKANILCIEKVDKKATMALWLKDDEIRSAEYKPYKMVEMNDGNVIIKNYYSLQLTADGGEGVFEILFPPYEIDRVAAMLGMTVVDRPY